MNTPVADHDGKTTESLKKKPRYISCSGAFFFFVILPVLWVAWLFFYATGPGPVRDGEPVAVVIPSRIGVAGIEKILVKNDVIRQDVRFRLLAWLTGKSKVLKAGEYLFQPAMTPAAVLLLLEQGKVMVHPVTIPEGADLEKIADILAAAGWVDKKTFLRLARHPDLIADLGLDVNSLEGYLFPDTYYLSRGTQNEVDIIRMMIREFLAVYREIGGEAEEGPLSRHEVVTLASIVEKETARDAERPMIARVFLNRLQKGMRLQADPTVIFGLPRYTGNLTRQDLITPTPYNTYVITGLPPGPICSPGRAALLAVLEPAAGDFLYFVSRNDGSHYFSDNLAEHNRAVSEYQR
jgi:UPF0755 protein